jgi:NAD(P)-dependent dehydrogenase (short-subunit alcohol dehydrogenase family)
MVAVLSGLPTRPRSGDLPITDLLFAPVSDHASPAVAGSGMTPQELFVIATAVAFLASKEARWITGLTVDADEGNVRY